MAGKRLKAQLAKVDRMKNYPLDEALKILKGTASAKFDESVDVAINLGISILPRRAVQTEVKRGELNYLRLRGHKLSRTISLVFHRTDSRPRVLTELIQLFRNLG